MANSENPVQSIFLEALEIKDPKERAQFIAQACGADSALCREVEELLRANVKMGQFLPEQPVTTAARAALVGMAEALNPGSSVSEVPLTEELGNRVGRYKLLEKIGEGGCGVVYIAEQEEPIRRRVALKIIKLGMDTKEVVARFEAERQALALMDHANIARIFDGGASDAGRPYFVMELVRGIRITEYCDQKHLSTRQRLDLFMQVCHAVQHAHQKGIIHRDLKPSNILVTVNDGVPVPKVIDFGIAKATGQRLTDKTLFTKFQQLIGTPAYMSPEQTEMTSVDIDTRSDLYSLGVLLYELLTGRTPFDAKELLRSGVEEILRTIREQEPARPSRRLSTLAAADQTTAAHQRQTEPNRLICLLRGDLDWIVMKCLEKDRSRRYETAHGLAIDLQRHLNNEPVLAGPPTAAYYARKLIRKHRAGVSIAAAFVLLLTTATGVSLRLAARANRERANALRAEGVANTSRAKAEEEARGRLDALTAMQTQRAEDLFAADDSNQALAVLADVLTRDPSNRVAAERILSALTLGKNTQPWPEPLRLEPLRHEGAVYRAQFSPDGLRVLTASRDGTARVWDARTGNPLTEPMRHKGWVLAAQFSPDGLRVSTASDDNSARVWNAQSGKPFTEPLRHESRVNSVQFSPDGLRIVTASHDSTARVWDARTGNPLTDPMRHKGWVLTAQFSPDGLRIVTASQDGTARVWEAHTGKPLGDPLRHGSEVYSAQFSPDGMRIVTASYDNTARVWEARTGLAVTKPLRHDGEVYSAQFSSDGLWVVTASQDKTARVWEAKTGKPLSEPLRHKDRLHSAQFSPNGVRVLTASRDRKARVWDTRTGAPLTEPLWHEGSVLSAQFSPDGLWVVTASEDNTARVWEMTFSSMPLPPWLLLLISGTWLTGTDGEPVVAPEDILKLKGQLRTAPTTNFYMSWVKWFLADPYTRTISPLSSITVPEYVHRRIEENTLESLREATTISYTNGLAFARLSRQVLAQDPKDNPGRIGQAAFFSKRAIDLSPNDPEVRRIRAEIVERIKNTQRP